MTEQFLVEELQELNEKAKNALVTYYALNGARTEIQKLLDKIQSEQEVAPENEEIEEEVTDNARHPD